MSKLALIGIVSAGGAGAVGVGGYALFGNGFGFGGGSDTSVTPRSDVSNSNPSDTPQAKTTPPTPQIVHTQALGGDARSYDKNLETLNNLGEVIKQGECFKEVFGDDLSLDNITDSESFDLANTNFGEPITIPEKGADSSNRKNTGCVFVQTNKVTYPNNKYTGIFSWAWAFRGKDKGLAVFGVANTNITTQKLDVEGVVYLLDKTDDSETWTVTHSKKSEKKALSSGEAGSKLPNANTGNITGNVNHADGQWLSAWQLENIADAQSATGGTAEPAAYRPDGHYDQYETHSKIYYGCTNLDGFDNLFDFNPSKHLTDKLKEWKGVG